MPGLFETKQTEQRTIPEWFENPFFGGLRQAQDLLAAGPFGGPYIAPTNPLQQQGISAGVGAGEAMLQQGMGLTPGLGSAFDFYQGQLGPGSSSPWLQNTQDYLGLASQVASTPYLQGQIDAALRDPFRQLTEQALPGIQRSFMGDDAGSSREAIMSGIAQRGYADRASDVAAQMRGQAYNQGLGFADQAARQDFLGQQGAASNLANLGGQGLGYMAGGAGQIFGAGQNQFGLDEAQRAAQERQFYQPWQLLGNYGSYVNPLMANAVGTNIQNDMGLWNGLLGIGGQILGGMIGGQPGGWNPFGAIGDFVGGLFGGQPQGGAVGSAGQGSGAGPAYDPYGTGVGYDPFGLFGGGFGGALSR